MKLLVFILNQNEKLEEILEGFLEIGIRGATILDSVGMGKIISEEIPVFAGLRELFSTANPSNKTILSVIDDELVEPSIRIINKIMGGLEQGGGKGILFYIDIDKYVGPH